MRNFLNGLVIHLRGTKENPKNPNDVLAKHRSEIPKKTSDKPKTEFKPKTDFKKKPASNNKKVEPKVQVVEKVRFNNGKAKK